MQLEDYTTGTVSISNGTATLTGTGTAWDVAGFKAGDTFHAQGLVGIIASVDSDTAITLRDLWTGTTISGGDYLLRYQPDNSRMQGTTRQVLDELRQGIWLTPDATGKTADKATYDARPAGFRFLDVSVDPFKLYVKLSDTSGDWSAGASWVGPQGQPGADGSPDGGRPVLTANRTYYVRTDGNDANDGLTNTGGGAFKTVQKALDVILGTLDLGGFNITIQVAAGTYAGAVSFASPQVGAGDITISGDTTTPSNVTMNVAGTCVTVNGAGCRLFVQGVKFVASTSWFLVSNGGYLKTSGKNEFSDAGGHGMQATKSGIIDAVAPEILSGSTGGGHYQANMNGVIYCQSATWTTSGTASRNTFAWATTGGIVYAFANTLTGSLTGKRYVVSTNAVVNTAGGGASYFPGDTTGIVSTGGQYA